MKINFKDIKIPNIFLQHPPKEYKLKEEREYYASYNDITHKLVVNKSGILLDGYISYLVLKENNFSGELEVEQRKNKTIYAYAKHPGVDKEFVWKVPSSLCRTVKNLESGKMINVETKDGVQQVEFCRYESRDTKPRKGYIKKVVSVCNI